MLSEVSRMNNIVIFSEVVFTLIFPWKLWAVENSWKLTMSEHSNQLHQTRLKCLCRVCGCSLKHSRTIYDSKSHKDDLMGVLHIDITRNSPSVHPGHLCEKCKTVLSKSTKATAEGRVYRPSVQDLWVAASQSQRMPSLYCTCGRKAKEESRTSNTEQYTRTDYKHQHPASYQ